MNVLYLFRKSGNVRIPFLCYNPALFHSFLSIGGKWENISHSFVFTGDVDTEQINKIIQRYYPTESSVIPVVQIQENSVNQPLISGFLEPQPSLTTGKWSGVEPSYQRYEVRGSPLDHPLDYSPEQSPEITPFDYSPNNDEYTEYSHVKKAAALPSSPFSFPVSKSLPEKLSVQLIEKLEAELRSRKYSVQTRRAYIYYNRLICRTLQKPPEEIRQDDVTAFLALMEKDKKYSASALNLAISAIKFFFKFVLKKDDLAEKHRPRHDGRLPMILSKEEISKILSLEKNPKHRLLLMLVYSSGLRVSEVVALKKEHIDLSRKVILIRLGKGRKDRSTLLSEKAANYIVEYYKFFNIDKWIFPGQPAEKHLSIRSAQNIFDKAVRRAAIPKEISIHTLRHTFATHLLESGTDIRYIQSLLGHSSLRTTELYTHVARRNVLSIKSPLDTIP
jgi:integrase/recombinase XerD